MNAPAPISFISALKDFFGFKPGQTLMEFRDEINALTHKDKLEIHEGLNKLGKNVAPPVEKK